MTHLIHIKTLLSEADYYDHFKDEEMEAGEKVTCSRSWGCVLSSYGCPNNTPQPGGLKQQVPTLSQFWRLQGHNRGVGGTLHQRRICSMAFS